MRFARGTSDNAALYARYLLEGVAGIPVMLGAPSLASLYDVPTRLGGWRAIGVSQSGETREIADSLRWAGAHGAGTLAVTNGEGSPVAAAAERCLLLGSGPELAVALTKTFTAECAALAALAYGWSDRRPGWEAVRAALHVEAAAAPSEALGALLHLDRLALVLGRGFHVPLAQELALKIMESCGVWATGMSWADLLHGPIAAVPSSAACLLLESGDRLSRSAHDLEARLADVGVHALHARRRCRARRDRPAAAAAGGGGAGAAGDPRGGARPWARRRRARRTHEGHADVSAAAGLPKARRL